MGNLQRIYTYIIKYIFHVNPFVARQVTGTGDEYEELKIVSIT